MTFRGVVPPSLSRSGSVVEPGVQGAPEGSVLANLHILYTHPAEFLEASDRRAGSDRSQIDPSNLRCNGAPDGSLIHPVGNKAWEGSNDIMYLPFLGDYVIRKSVQKGQKRSPRN